MRSIPASTASSFAGGNADTKAEVPFCPLRCPNVDAPSPPRLAFDQDVKHFLDVTQLLKRLGFGEFKCGHRTTPL
jgi:hypothetical protein